MEDFTTSSLLGLQSEHAAVNADLVAPRTCPAAGTTAWAGCLSALQTLPNTSGPGAHNNPMNFKKAFRRTAGMGFPCLKQLWVTAVAQKGTGTRIHTSQTPAGRRLHGNAVQSCHRSSLAQLTAPKAASFPGSLFSEQHWKSKSANSSKEERAVPPRELILHVMQQMPSLLTSVAPHCSCSHNNRGDAPAATAPRCSLKTKVAKGNQIC